MPKLIAIEYIQEEDRVVTFPKGYKYTLLKDEETGKYYEPVPGWIVKGKDLSDLFREVDPSAKES